MRLKRMIHNSVRIAIETTKYFRPCRMSTSLPGMLYFQVTDACNANCVFCGFQYYKSRNKVMPLDIFEKGVRQYAEMGGGKISFSPIVGEPLLDPHLFERIELARRLRVKVGFYTNGISLNNGGNVEKILGCQNIFRICISTAGFERQMFERVMRSKRYDAFIDGVEALLRGNSRMENPLDICLTLKPDKKVSDALSDRDFVDRILPHIPRSKIACVVAYDNWCGTVTQGDLVGRMILAKPPILKRKPCTSLYLPMITVDGKVRACACRFARDFDDELIVGDLNEKNLSEIWHGEKIRRLRQSFYDGALPEPCRSCSVYKPASGVGG